MSTERREYRFDIDGLRAFAVIAVILNHFNSNFLPSGFLGVDIFFVISGFVITSSFSIKDSKNLRELLCDFYSRRIKRLFPALLFVVFFCSILICLVNPKPDASLITGMTSLFGISNLYLFKESTNYFAESTKLNVFLHTWSLSVEEQFYFFFPFLIWISGYGINNLKKAKKLFYLLLIPTSISVILFIWLFNKNPTAGYFLMPGRFWEMAAGSLLFLSYQNIIGVFKKLSKIPIPLILLLMVGTMFLPRSYILFSIFSIVFLTSLFILNIQKDKLFYKIFTSKKIVYLGKISYSLYLWHWTIISLSYWTIGVYWWTIPFQLTLIYYISIFSYEKIENPIRKNKFFKFKNFNTKLISITQFLIFFMIIGILKLQDSYFLYLGNKGYAIQEKTSYPPGFFFLDKNIDKNINKSKLLVLGDSHAGHLWGMLENSSVRNERNLIMHIRGKGFHKKIESSNSDYDHFIGDVFKYYYKNLNTNDVIILSVDGSGQPVRESVKKAFQDVTKLSYKKNIKVILVNQTPEIFNKIKQKSYLLCENNFLRSHLNPDRCLSAIDRNKLIKRGENLNEFLSYLANQYSNVYVFDAFRILCPNDKCQNKFNDRWIYSDSDHLNDFGSKLLTNEFDIFLNKIQTEK